MPDFHVNMCFQMLNEAARAAGHSRVQVHIAFLNYISPPRAMYHPTSSLFLKARHLSCQRRSYNSIFLNIFHFGCSLLLLGGP